MTYGLDLIRFDAEIDARSQLTSVRRTGWTSPRPGDGERHGRERQRRAWGNLTAADARPGRRARGLRHRERGAADGRAISRPSPRRAQTRAELARLRGQVRFQGSAAAKLGATLELAGARRPLQRHRADLQRGPPHRERRLDHRCRARPRPGLADRSPRRRRPRGRRADPPARGLQIGKVAKLTEDPASQNRIQVLLPLLGAEGSALGPARRRLLLQRRRGDVLARGRRRGDRRLLQRRPELPGGARQPAQLRAARRRSRPAPRTSSRPS